MTKRTILAFALSVVFFVAYVRFLQPLIVGPTRPQENAPETQAVASTDSSLAPAPVAEKVTPEAGELPTQPVEAEQPAAGAHATPDRYRQENAAVAEIAVSCDPLAVVFTTRTGSIKSVTLNTFNAFGDSKHARKMLLLTDFEEGQYPTAITRLAGRDLGNWLYVQEPSPPQEAPGQKQAAFAAVLPDGTKVTKTYTLHEGRYGINLDIRLENLTAEKRDISYQLLGPAGIPAESYDNEGNNIQGVIAAVWPDGKMSLEMKPAWALLAKGDIATAPTARANFAGATNQYFAAVLRPSPEVPLEGSSCYPVLDSARARVVFGDVAPRQAVKGLNSAQAANALKPVYYMTGARFTVGKVELDAANSANAVVTHSYLLYAGPKDKGALAAFDAPGAVTGFSTLLDYGWLEWLVKGILYLMKAFYAVIPNWGVAIILLTFLIRALMHPLTKKSQVSMAKMQKLQPEIKKLQDKYKSDKQKLGAEQMKLMNEAGANPLGGCLPMLIQLPIFFALYRGLMVSIELRQAPFVLWINDLAQPDRLFLLPFSLPLVRNEFNLIPLLMLGAMIWQQKMTPQAPSAEAAQQQKIMGMFMPAFIGILLYRVASGLNLYIFTSTAFGIVEQWIIKRHIAAGESV